MILDPALDLSTVEGVIRQIKKTRGHSQHKIDQVLNGNEGEFIHQELLMYHGNLLDQRLAECTPLDHNPIYWDGDDEEWERVFDFLDMRS